MLLANPAGVLGEHPAADSGESAGRASQDGHGPGVVHGADVLGGDADREVGKTVAVEVAGREHLTEGVAVLGRPAGADGVLGEQVAAGTGQAVCRTVENGHGAAGCLGAALERYADGEIGEPVVVEVASGEGVAEEVARLCRAADAGGVLRIRTTAAGGEPARRAGNHVDLTGVHDRPDVLAGNTHREIVEPVVR